MPNLCDCSCCFSYESTDTTWIDSVSMEYHIKQWNEPKESTKAFADVFRSKLANSLEVIDLGAGAGAATFFLANQFPQSNFIGIEYSNELINIAKQNSAKVDVNNLSFEWGDWFNLEKRIKRVDGVISLQTLSWLPEMRSPMIKYLRRLNQNGLGFQVYFTRVTSRAKLKFASTVEVERHSIIFIL